MHAAIDYHTEAPSGKRSATFSARIPVSIRIQSVDRRRTYEKLTYVLIAVAALVGCGGGGSTASNSPGTPTGSTGVVFIADRETYDLPEIYYVPSNGGTPLPLSRSLAGQGIGVKKFAVSPDRTRVAFVAGPAGLGNNLNEIYSVSMNGASLQKTSSGEDVGGDRDEIALAFDFDGSPDGPEVAYLAGSGATLQGYRTRIALRVVAVRP